jgi:hypothetical protein
MTSIIDLLFTQETLNKLENLFYTTFYCNTYTGFENVLTEITDKKTGYLKYKELQKIIDTYLLITQNKFTTDDDTMSEIIFQSVLKLFINIIISNLFPDQLKYLHRKFILPITGNMNYIKFVKSQPQRDVMNIIHGEDIYAKYGIGGCLKYIKDELYEYFKFKPESTSILK